MAAIPLGGEFSARINNTYDAVLRAQRAPSEQTNIEVKNAVDELYEVVHLRQWYIEKDQRTNKYRFGKKFTTALLSQHCVYKTVNIL